MFHRSPTYDLDLVCKNFRAFSSDYGIDVKSSSDEKGANLLLGVRVKKYKDANVMLETPN